MSDGTRVTLYQQACLHFSLGMTQTDDTRIDVKLKAD
jgi:hypothetical protein